MYQLLPIARKRSHVIEEDQCVNMAFLMQGLCMGRRPRPPSGRDVAYWHIPEVLRAMSCGRLELKTRL
jgi:hypothetical protein